MQTFEERLFQAAGMVICKGPKEGISLLKTSQGDFNG